MMNDSSEFNPVTPRPHWPKMEQLSQPALPVLADFVHRCSNDPATRTATVTLFVASLCQLAGRGMMARMPSVLVVNAHDLVPDATDLVASRMVANSQNSGPRVYYEGRFMQGTPEQAPAFMARAILAKQQLGKVTPNNASVHQAQEKLYFDAQRTGFGHGPSRCYAKAWHDTFDLITDRGDKVILRIDAPQDQTAFRKDVIEAAIRLREPLGYGRGLKEVAKHIAISGSSPASQVDATLAKGIVELELPFLLLPSVAKTPPEIANKPIFDLIAASLPDSFTDPVEEPANLIQEGYGSELRMRLRHLPADYEYSMQKLARQLFPVCLRIASWCGKYSGSTNEEIMAVTDDLCGHALRGLVLSIAGLAWHGLGIDAGCPHPTTVRVLEYLRLREPMTMSELARGAHLAKKERDLLVERLRAEDLIRVEGKIVTATSYAEFVESLHQRKEFPEPQNHWAKVSKKAQAAA